MRGDEMLFKGIVVNTFYGPGIIREGVRYGSLNVYRVEILKGVKKGRLLWYPEDDLEVLESEEEAAEF